MNEPVLKHKSGFFKPNRGDDHQQVDTDDGVEELDEKISDSEMVEDESESESDMSVILLSNEDESEPEKNIPVIISPPRKILTMARKSTSPHKVLINLSSVTFTIGLIFCLFKNQIKPSGTPQQPPGADILVKREMARSEKSSRTIKKTCNQIDCISTTRLIDYLITGSKYSEKVIGHEKIEIINKSFEEFRSWSFLSNFKFSSA